MENIVRIFQAWFIFYCLNFQNLMSYLVISIVKRTKIKK